MGKLWFPYRLIAAQNEARGELPKWSKMDTSSLSSLTCNLVAAPGAFSLERGKNGSGIDQLIAGRCREVFWTSGALSMNDQCFKNTVWLTSPFTASQNNNFSYVSNENESYFSYSVFNGAMSSWHLKHKPVFLAGATCYTVPGCRLTRGFY